MNAKTPRRKAYSPGEPLATQEARSREQTGPGGMNTEPSASWDTRSMTQLELSDFRFDGEHPWRDEGILRELYIERGLTQTQTAKRLNTTPTTVGKWLREYGIEIRTYGSGPEVDLPGGERELRILYEEKGLTSGEIGDRWGCSSQTILDRLDRYGIEKRKRGGRPGELNAAWEGGHVTHRRGAWQRQRKAAKERDDFACRWCGVSDGEHKEQTGHGLDVHHIAPYSSFDDPFEANELANLLTLCRDCHIQIEGLSNDALDREQRAEQEADAVADGGER